MKNHSRKFFSIKRPSISSSSSLEIIGYNEDIMTHVSLYLPVKSILRFRSVSKQWNSLLTHHQFIQRFASHKSANPFLFLQYCSAVRSLHLNGDSHNLDMVDFGYMKNSNLILKRSCNGLLLFQFISYEEREKSLRHRYYICNPFTRKYTELAVGVSIATTWSSPVYLAFDPSKSPHYKVIFFWCNSNTNDEYFDPHISIYSSDTRTCRKLAYTVSKKIMQWFVRGVFFNGAIFMVNSCWDRTSSILYFDINQESITEFPRPSYPTSHNDLMYFGECQGHLQLIFGNPLQRVCQRETIKCLQCVFDVFELKDDNSGWFVKYKVNLDTIAIDFPEIIIYKNSQKHYTYPNFLHVLEEDEKDPRLILSFGNKLLDFNFIDNTTKKLCDTLRPFVAT